MSVADGAGVPETVGSVGVRALAFLCGAGIAVILASVTGVFGPKEEVSRVEPKAVALVMTPSEMRQEIARVNRSELGEREAAKGRIIAALLHGRDDAGSTTEVRACIEEVSDQPIEALLRCIELL
jgi:hypothetical protein